MARFTVTGEENPIEVIFKLSGWWWYTYPSENDGVSSDDDIPN
jgi:hypothetical protein